MKNRKNNRQAKSLYDHPGLTATQRQNMTATTKTGQLDMTNKVALQAGDRYRRYIARQDAAA